MNRYQPLNCDLHDYLEIACMHGYTLQVELLEGGQFQAQALTTHTAASKEEFLTLRTADGQRDIRLDQLLAITPLTERASFGRVELANQVCSL